MASWSRLASVAAILILIAVFLPVSLRAGTDANGFFDTYLTAIAYDAQGANPPADQIDQDYLCDGDENESEIIPEEGLVLVDPSLVIQAECGDVTVAGRAFDTDALLVAGELPIRVDTINNSTLDFVQKVRDVFGDNRTASNVMAYAWVYVTNHTNDPLELTMGIGSDDSIQVKVNRVEVFRHKGGRGSGGNNTVQDRFPVVFQPGGNLVQFKVWQGGGGWNMRARLEPEGDCPPSGRAPRDAIQDDPGGILSVDVIPVALPVVVAAQRTIVSSGGSPDTVTADITVNIDNGGAAWDLVENFDPGWELVSANPAASDIQPGQTSWNGVTAGSITYTLRRSDLWDAEDGAVSGLNTLGGIVAPVQGDRSISGGLTPYVSEALLTASLNLADFDAQGLPFNVTGCNVTPTQIEGAWIVGTVDGGNPVTDANIIPAEGLEINLDFGGARGGASQADFLSLVGPEAEDRFWKDPGNIRGGMVLQPVTSGDGYYNFQRGDIFGAVDQTMCVAYFYAINTEAAPRKVVCAFGSDDSGGVRVNGRSVHAITACRGVPQFASADRFEIQLDPGKNLIACYTFEAGGGFGLRIRFEDENFLPIRLPTTLNPDGYDPAAHPDPGDLETFTDLFVPAVLATAALSLEGLDFSGNDIPAANIAGDWITGEDGVGNPVTDTDIVPFDGMTLFPDFGGASQATGLLEIAQVAKDIFWTDPLDPLTSGTHVVRVTSGDGFYNWQRGNIFTGNPNPDVTMNVAWFYAINEDAAARCVTLSFGSDDSGGVRVNGRVVHTITIGRGTPQFDASDKVLLQLDPGKNLIACYTFDNAGGWGLRIRFEDGGGNPLSIPTTTDPAGYNPDPAAHPEPECAPQTVADGYVRGGGANGIVTQFLVPLRPFEHGNTGGGTRAGAVAENYISIAGDPPEEDTVFEGAQVEPGIDGIDDPGQLAITTGVRGSSCGITKLVKFDGFVEGDGPGDPGDFNADRYYRQVVRTVEDSNAGRDQISYTKFFFIDNLTDGVLPAWFGFASDDGAHIYLNGQLIMERIPGRGRGGNNVLQDLATDPVDLLPGVNFVQMSVKQGGGGVGSRIGFYADDCLAEAFTPQQVRVTANPPGFVPGPEGSGVTASREVSSFGCDNTGTVTLTIQIPGGGSADVELEELLPDGLSGSKPSAGVFDAAGSVLTFTGQASDGMVITYEVSDVARGNFGCSTIDGNVVEGAASFTNDTCRTRCLQLSDTGAVLEMLIIGPIDAGGDTNTNGLCDDNGNLAMTDYLANDEFDETDIAVGLGDEIQPDFGGDAGGVGVKASPNPNINPKANEGILTVFLGPAQDNDGRINLNQGDIIGNPVNDYIVYGLTYLDNLDADPRNVVLEVGSDDAVKVLVNGLVVHVNSVCRGIPGYGAGDRVPVTLEPGRNTVLIAVVERGGGTDMRLVVRDELDLPIVDGSVVTCRLGEDLPPSGDRFRRGDTDASGVVDISDPIFNLTFQFVGGVALVCFDAADVDDSGVVDISDPIYSLTFQFVGGIAPPPAPGPADCGPDPSADGIACEGYPQEKC